MQRTAIDVTEVVQATLGERSALLDRRVDRPALIRRAQELHRNPFGNLEKLVEPALYPETDEYLIVTDLDADAASLRSFLRRNFFAYRALRARLMRDSFVRGELKDLATGFLGRVTSVDVFRYIARTSKGAAAVSLLGKAVVLLLPGFHDADKARAGLEAASAEDPVLHRLADFSDEDLLSFVIRLHVRHEGAHSEDSMQHMAGTRNRYSAEPESDSTMTLFAMRDAELLGLDRLAILRSVALLRDLAGEVYLFCGAAMRLSLEVRTDLLVRLTDREINLLADAIADSVVPSYETLRKVESGIA
jgi:hypothetical protein